MVGVGEKDTSRMKRLGKAGSLLYGHRTSEERRGQVTPRARTTFSYQAYMLPLLPLPPQTLPIPIHPFRAGNDGNRIKKRWIRTRVKPKAACLIKNASGPVRKQALSLRLPPVLMGALKPMPHASDSAAAADARFAARTMQYGAAVVFRDARFEFYFSVSFLPFLSFSVAVVAVPLFLNADASLN